MKKKISLILTICVVIGAIFIALSTTPLKASNVPGGGSGGGTPILPPDPCSGLMTGSEHCTCIGGTWWMGCDGAGPGTCVADLSSPCPGTTPDPMPGYTIDPSLVVAVLPGGTPVQSLVYMGCDGTGYTEVAEDALAAEPYPHSSCSATLVAWRGCMGTGAKQMVDSHTNPIAHVAGCRYDLPQDSVCVGWHGCDGTSMPTYHMLMPTCHMLTLDSNTGPYPHSSCPSSTLVAWRGPMGTDSLTYKDTSLPANVVPYSAGARYSLPLDTPCVVWHGCDGADSNGVCLLDSRTGSTWTLDTAPFPHSGCPALIAWRGTMGTSPLEYRDSSDSGDVVPYTSGARYSLPLDSPCVLWHECDGSDTVGRCPVETLDAAPFPHDSCDPCASFTEGTKSRCLCDGKVWWTGCDGLTAGSCIQSSAVPACSGGGAGGNASTGGNASQGSSAGSGSSTHGNQGGGESVGVGSRASFMNRVKKHNRDDNIRKVCQESDDACLTGNGNQTGSNGTSNPDDGEPPPNTSNPNGDDGGDGGDGTSTGGGKNLPGGGATLPGGGP